MSCLLNKVVNAIQAYESSENIDNLKELASRLEKELAMIGAKKTTEADFLQLTDDMEVLSEVEQEILEMVTDKTLNEASEAVTRTKSEYQGKLREWLASGTAQELQRKKDKAITNVKKYEAKFSDAMNEETDTLNEVADTLKAIEKVFPKYKAIKKEYKDKLDKLYSEAKKYFEETDAAFKEAKAQVALKKAYRAAGNKELAKAAEVARKAAVEATHDAKNKRLEIDSEIEGIQSELDMITKAKDKLVKAQKIKKVRTTNQKVVKEDELDSAKDKLGKAKAAKEIVLNRVKKLRRSVEKELGNAVRSNNAETSTVSYILDSVVDAEKPTDEEVSSIIKMLPSNMQRDTKIDSTVRSAIKILVGFQNKIHGGATTAVAVNQGIKLDSATDNKNPLLKDVNKLLTTTDKGIRKLVNNAMSVTTMQVVVDMVSMRTSNAEQINNTVKSAYVGPLESRVDGLEVSEEVKDSLANKIRSGEAIPVATFIEKAGKTLLKELEVKLDTKDLQMQDKIDIEIALGELVVNNVLPKFVVKDKVNTAEYQFEYGYLPKTTNVKVNEDSVEVGGKYEEGATTIRAMDIRAIQDWYRRGLESANGVFKYAREMVAQGVTREPQVKEGTQKVRSSGMDKAKEANDYGNKLGSAPFKFSNELDKVLEDAYTGLRPAPVRGEPNSDITNKDVREKKQIALDKSYDKAMQAYEQEKIDRVVKLVLGDRDELAGKTHPYNRDSELSKYDAEALEIERMLIVYEDIGKDEFYLGHDYTISGRTMIDNSMLNPQSSKISRFLVHLDKMKTDNVDPQNMRKEDIELANLAIAQALDEDPDKNLYKDTLNTLKTGKNFWIDGTGAHASNPEVQKLIDGTGEVKLSDIRRVFDEGHLKSGHIMHLYQALNYANNTNKGEKFTGYLVLESDGITNGMIATLLQMGYTPKVAELLAKGGMYVGENISYPEGHAGQRDAQTKAGKMDLDIYSAPLKNMIDELGPIAPALKGILGDEVTKWRSSWLKPMIMVYIYGASIGNITRRGAEHLVSTALENSNTVREVEDKLVGVLGETIKIDKETSMSVRGLFEVDNDGFIILKDRGNMDVLTKAVNKVVGDPIKKAFEGTFAPVNRFRKTLKTVNQVNYLVFRQALADKMEKLKKQEMGELTSDELTKIMNELVKEGTYYGSENMFGATHDYIKSATVSGNGELSIVINKGGSYFKGNTLKEQVFNKRVKELQSNVGSIGVTDIHSVDGGTMIKGHYTDVLNIFDALVMNIEPELNKEQLDKMNEEFYKANIEHSILGKAVKRLVDTDPELLAKALDNADTSSLTDDMYRITEINKYDKKYEKHRRKFAKEIYNVRNTLDELDKAKRKMLEESDNTDSGQYYISANVAKPVAMGKLDGHKEWKEGVANTRYAVWDNDSKIAKEERSKVGGALDRLDGILRGVLYAKEDAVMDADTSTYSYIKLDSSGSNITNFKFVYTDKADNKHLLKAWVDGTTVEVQDPNGILIDKEAKELSTDQAKNKLNILEQALSTYMTKLESTLDTIKYLRSSGNTMSNEPLETELNNARETVKESVMKDYFIEEEQLGKKENAKPETKTQPKQEITMPIVAHDKEIIDDMKPWTKEPGELFAQRITDKQAKIKGMTLDTVNNFGNPFTTIPNKEGDNINRQTGTAGVVTQQMYDWLTEGKVPTNYDGDRKLLEHRRQFILANKDKIKAATKIGYNGTAKNAPISHVDALIAFAYGGSNADLQGTTNKYTIQVTASVDKVKAPYKLSKANKYIGFGVGSTGSYATQLKKQGMPVNNGKYTKDDVVFMSINGRGKLTPRTLRETQEEVVEALESGAKVLGDSAEYLAEKGKGKGANYTGYNTGEARLTEYLLNKGYERTTDPDMIDVGVWQKPKQESATTQETKQTIEEEAEDVSGLMEMLEIVGGTEDSFEVGTVMESQLKILEVLSKKGAKEAIKEAGKHLQWIKTSDRKVTKERRERAKYKTYDHKTGEAFDEAKLAKNKSKYEKRTEGNEERYLLLQLVEELGELGVELLVDDDSYMADYLELQKRVLKTIRFGKDTVIKDSNSPYNGKTNMEALVESLKDTSYEYELNDKSTTEDLVQVIEFISKDMQVGKKKDSGTIHVTNRKQETKQMVDDYYLYC